MPFNLVKPISYREFISLIYPKYVWTNFHALLADSLQAVFEGKITRLAVSVPPRHGKSYQISELFAAYCFARFPLEQIIASSNSASLAHRFGSKVRTVMGTPIYSSLFPWAIIPGDGKTGKTWGMENFNKMLDTHGDKLYCQIPEYLKGLIDLYSGFVNGTYYSTGVGGSTVGLPATLSLVDDPIKNRKQAESPVYIKGLKDWFGADLYTRLEPGARMVVVHTRWNNQDLIAHIKEKYDDEKNWTYLSFSALACENDILGRTPGQALFPAKFPEKTLLKIKESISPADWSALYQQDPVAGSGKQWKVEYAKVCNPLEISSNKTLRFRLASWDCASSLSSTADYTGFIILSVYTDGTIVVEKADKFRVEFGDLLAKFREVFDAGISINLIEKASNGIALLQFVQVNLAKKYSEKLFTVNAHTDKTLEMSLAIESLKDKVYFSSNCGLLGDLMAQLTEHPHGQESDMSIALVQAIRWLQTTDLTQFDKFIAEKQTPSIQLVKKIKKRQKVWH